MVRFLPVLNLRELDFLLGANQYRKIMTDDTDQESDDHNWQKHPPADVRIYQ